MKSRRIYIMLAPFRHPLRYKVGISNDTARRAEEVGAFVLFSVVSPLARPLETAFHRVFAPLSAPAGGDGKTEWFWCLNPVALAALWFFGATADWWWLALFVVPVDCLLLLLLVAALHIAAIVGAVLAAAWALHGI